MKDMQKISQYITMTREQTNLTHFELSWLFKGREP